MVYWRTRWKTDTITNFTHTQTHIQGLVNIPANTKNNKFQIEKELKSISLTNVKTIIMIWKWISLFNLLIRKYKIFKGFWHFFIFFSKTHNEYLVSK